MLSGIAAVVRVDIENALKDDEWSSTDLMQFLKDKYENETSIDDQWWQRLTHIAKSWKIFPKIGWSLRGFLGKFFQTFFKISDFGSWVRSFSGKFFQPNFLSTYSGKKFVFWFRVMSEELFWKIFPASFYECLLRKKVCSHYLGMTRKRFENFSRLHREMHENPTCYTKYLLRLAQGFCTQSMKRPSAPVRVGNRTFSRSRCRSCRDITPYKDTRTTQKCVRCNAGCCTTHSRIICSQCYDS